MRCKNAMKCSKYRTKLEQPGTIHQFTPTDTNLRTTWRRLADNVIETERRSVTFSDLAEFVDNEARVIANPVFEKITEDTKPKNERRDKQNRSGRGRTRLATQAGDLQSPPLRAPPSRSTPPTEDVLCSFCNSGHALDACEALRRLLYPQRTRFLRLKRLCFGCLSSNHMLKECPEKKTCMVANCTRKYATILHTNTAPRIRPSGIPSASTSPQEESPRVCNRMVNLNRLRIGMAAVPVKVWFKSTGPPVITYAFLDSGSSSSFCTESLMRQLGVNGTRTQISLTTLEKKDSLIDSFVVKGLVISDLDENVFIELPALYTRPEIPVSKEDIPAQGDIDQWPHLCGVCLPEVDAEIGLLVACDVPTVFDPLEVKHSQNGGPYASRTSMGWVVNGPLGRFRKGPRAASFLIKADSEFHQMVKNFYDSGFSESSAVDKP